MLTLMHDAPAPPQPTTNRLLSILLPDEREFIEPHLELVSFPVGHFVALAGDALKRCFFPNNGMISLLAETQNGGAVEVGFTGFEGMVGTPLVLGKNSMPYQALVQAPSDGYVVDTGRVLQLFAKRGIFHDAVLRYNYVEIRQLTQTAVCNHFHSIQSRMCRWLAVMCERSGHKQIRLTQEFLAHFLGVQRTSIGAIASSLQREGIIDYSRGKIEVLDLERLHLNSCECFHLICQEFAELLAVKKDPDMSGTRQTARV
ncbi:MAG TPA: Crp/Fnr family transcriptional regulator [Pyrinomonadaceae bacterium]|nr:Crp/Fnr family transcriptional regulator [Pyrinomonadaceae bacterium]